jgi:hypothetical protein
LLSCEAAQSRTFDLVVDTRGLAAELSLQTARIIDISQMR